VSLDELRAAPRGIRVGVETRHRKFADVTNGVVRGFQTPSGRIELYSETLLAHGYAPLPEFREPPMSPRARPDLAAAFPLVLTSAKSSWFCESQHRALPSLRRHARDPEVELHPDTARSRGIKAGDWVRVETPHGGVRARARLNADVHPDVVCGQHGWWQACAAIGAPGYDAFGETSSSLNLILRHQPSDPISASAPLRGYLCNVVRTTSSG
jgi:anaerobic selenocysteine-containing dehydrogenase